MQQNIDKAISWFLGRKKRLKVFITTSMKNNFLLFCLPTRVYSLTTKLIKIFKYQIFHYCHENLGYLETFISYILTPVFS